MYVRMYSSSYIHILTILVHAIIIAGPMVYICYMREIALEAYYGQDLDKYIS